jgi:hypothetical protein
MKRQRGTRGKESVVSPPTRPRDRREMERYGGLYINFSEQSIACESDYVADGVFKNMKGVEVCIGVEDL